MIRDEHFRKVSTTLFSRRNAQAGDWSSLLPNHTNLMNHQLYFMASAPITAGSFRVHIVPDTSSRIPATADTGFLVDFGGTKDSAHLNFTGVIKGLHFKMVDAFDAGITISAVLTSFSRMRQKEEEQFDYVSTTIFEDRASNTLTNFSLPTPNHLNMVYHQLMIISDGPVAAGEWELRVIPDADEDLETSVYLDENVQFLADPSGGDGSSYIGWFGGVFKGLHLKSVVAPEAGHLFTAILSSSVERFDQVIHSYIGSSPITAAHLLDLANPHQTSWSNLLNKPVALGDWPVIRNSIVTGEEYTVPTGFQMLVWDSFVYDGGNLILDGDLVVI